MAKKYCDIKVALNFLLKYYCSMVMMGTEFILVLQDKKIKSDKSGNPFVLKLTSMVNKKTSIHPFVCITVIIEKILKIINPENYLN